ncbi:MAG: hypothetical protein LBG72_03035 [Spirochaetaceae bacterium]|nr:hypothetical protein [Spirochaetaceae bacterium]
MPKRVGGWEMYGNAGNVQEFAGLADSAVRISRLGTRRPMPKRVGGWEMYENAGNVQGVC